MIGRTNAKYIGIAPETWAGVQGLVRTGLVDKVFQVGDQFTFKKSAVTYTLDLVDIGSSTRNVTANGNAPTDPTYFTQFPNAKPITLLMHDGIYGVVFDAPEANYKITTEIASGAKCNISLANHSTAAATYNFTAPSALAVGGRLRIIDATHIGYYTTPAATVVSILMAAGAADEEYLDISASLSVQNNASRVTYGSNKYTESAIRQWLNSGGAAATFWASKSDYDLAPSWHPTWAGFQNGLDPDLLAVIGETTREVELNTVTDGGGHTVISDKIFFPSRMEMFGAAESAGHKGVQFQAYVGSVDADRIKYDAGSPATARYWWLRSPIASNSFNARIVHTSGALYSTSAYNGYGAAAACVIL